jgi:hypothetical protein
MIFLDEFLAHLTKKQLATAECHLETVSCSFTWSLQVMDVWIHMPFKGRFRDNFKISSRNFQMDNGKNQLAQRFEVTELVRDAFQSISALMIKKTWKKIGVPLSILWKTKTITMTPRTMMSKNV